MVLTTNFCSPLMHQGQRAPWYLALTSHLHMDYVTHFEKKKMEASLFFFFKAFGCENWASLIGLQPLRRRK